MCLSIDSGRILARWVARECLNKWGYILLVIPAFIASVLRSLATHAGDTSLPFLFWLMLGHRKASRFAISGWKLIQKARAGTQAITLILLGPVFPFTNAWTPYLSKTTSRILIATSSPILQPDSYRKRTIALSRGRVQTSAILRTSFSVRISGYSGLKGRSHIFTHATSSG